MYRDKLTKKTIDASLISSDTSAGITYYDNGIWRFIAADQLEVIEETTDSDTVSSVVITSDVSTAEVDKIITASDITSNTEKYYAYYFGINTLEIANKEFYDKCAYVSPAMNVNIGSVLSLKADFTEGKYGSVEFSIIDGINEIPILPESQKEIRNEKVFYQLPVRFNTNEYKFYEDLTYIGSNMGELPFKQGRTYTVDYVPAAGGSHTAAHNSVRVKAIARMHKQGAAAPQINSITLIERKAT